MRTYKLLKELPGYSVGRIFAFDGHWRVKIFTDSGEEWQSLPTDETGIIAVASKDPEWLEPVVKESPFIIFHTSKLLGAQSYQLDMKLDYESSEAVKEAVMAMLDFCNGVGVDNGQWPAIVSNVRDVVANRED